QFLGPPPSLCTGEGTRSTSSRQPISPIADNGGVDEPGALSGTRSARQFPTVEGVHTRGQRHTGHQPNSLRGKQISDAQGAVVAVVAFGAGNPEECLLCGATQDRIPRWRRQQAHVAGGSLTGGGDHHGRAWALQDVAVRADEDDIAGAEAVGVPQSG